MSSGSNVLRNIISLACFFSKIVTKQINMLNRGYCLYSDVTTEWVAVLWNDMIFITI